MFGFTKVFCIFDNFDLTNTILFDNIDFNSKSTSSLACYVKRAFENQYVILSGRNTEQFIGCLKHSCSIDSDMYSKLFHFTTLGLIDPSRHNLPDIINIPAKKDEHDGHNELGFLPISSFHGCPGYLARIKKRESLKKMPHSKGFQNVPLESMRDTIEDFENVYVDPLMHQVIKDVHYSEEKEPESNWSLILSFYQTSFCIESQ